MKGEDTPGETPLHFPSRAGITDRIRPGIADRSDEEEYDRDGTGGEVSFYQDWDAA